MVSPERNKHSFSLSLTNAGKDGGEEREGFYQVIGEVSFSNFQSSFVDHSFFVYLVATLLNEIKQLFQVH